MILIGFDIGNENCVIAVVRRGGVDVLFLNEESKRKTPAVVSFVEKRRFFGSAGAAFATTNPKSTISHIKRLIGKLYKEVEEDLKLLPFSTSEGPRGGILIELEYLNTKWTFTPVELLGMLLKHMKQITEKNLDSPVVNCVIGIPSYFTDLQRRMYLDAATIAGLNPLRLMHDGTAIALGYGMYKTGLSYSGAANVMFVDIGHCDTQVTVAAFEPRKMKILSHSFDQNLGGRDFDEVLFKHFAAQFKETYKIDVFADTRASIRLRASCEKVKKALSANAQAPLIIESLIGDTDVRGVITRLEFEKLSKELLDRVIVPCNMAIQDAGLNVDEIHTIELVGSGSRIPAITRTLTRFFKKEPTRTLNARECVARGCALRCAMLSPTLIVGDYKIEDSFPYSIIVRSPLGEELMHIQKGSPFPKIMTVKHRRITPFNIQVTYTNEGYFPAGISHIVGHFKISTSETSYAEKVDVEFRVKLNNHGIVKIDSAEVFRGYFYRRIPMYTREMLKLQISENLDFVTTNDGLCEAKDKEKMLVEQEIKVEETKDQRNTLLYTVYDTRRKLSGAYRSHAKDSETEIITKELQKIEDWLYENGDDKSEQHYTGRIKDLEKLLEPIEYRYNEEKAVAEATSFLKSFIKICHSHVDLLPDDKKERIKMECRKAEEWLTNAVSQKHLSSKTFSIEINHTIDVFKRNCETIIGSKPSFSTNKEQGEYKSAWEKAAKPLQTCMKKYKLLAESLPTEKKDEITNVCRKVDRWLAEVDSWLAETVSQRRLDLKTLSAGVIQAIDYVESNCKIIISSESSFPSHEEPVGSDQMDQTVESDQKDQSLESDDVRTVATKALQACIAKYRSSAKSLPIDMKAKVKDECMTAEEWLSSLSRSFSSPNTLATYINRFKERFESNCEGIIRSKPSSSNGR